MDNLKEKLESLPLSQLKEMAKSLGLKGTSTMKKAAVIELLLAEEGIRETGHNKIFIGHPIAISDGFRALLEGEGGVDACVDILRPMSNQEVKEWIRTMDPNYTPTSNR